MKSIVPRIIQIIRIVTATSLLLNFILLPSTRNVHILTIGEDIDDTKPNDFNVTITPHYWSSKPERSIYFSTFDSGSGIDHYDIAIDNKWYYNIQSPFKTAPNNDGIYFVAIRAYDKAGHFTDAIGKYYVDSTPPKIYHNPMEFMKIKTGDKINITAKVIDYTSGVDKVYLFYKSGGNNTIKIKIMERNNDNFFITFSPRTIGKSDFYVIEYYFEAMDLSSPPNRVYLMNSGKSNTIPVEPSYFKMVIAFEDDPELRTKTISEVKEDKKNLYSYYGYISSVSLIILFVILIILIRWQIIITLARMRRKNIEAHYKFTT